MIIVIVVDGQQVPVDVRVPHQDIDVGDLVNVLQQPIELFKLARLGSLQRKPSKFCPKLQQKISYIINVEATELFYVKPEMLWN